MRTHKWPKRHAHVLEGCRALDVRDVLPQLDWRQRAFLRSWRPPAHPSLLLVLHPCGPFDRRFFLCPRCRRRCETLYIAPDSIREDWRCRRCIPGGAVYACQRYGFRHPLRKRLTPRKRVSLHKRATRQMRRTARLRERWKRRWEVQRSQRSTGVQRQALRKLPVGDLNITVRVVDSSRPTPVEPFREQLDALAPKAIACLRGIVDNPRAPKRVRASARRRLVRLGELPPEPRAMKPRRPQAAKASAPPKPSVPSPVPSFPFLTAEDDERINRVLAEARCSSLPQPSSSLSPNRKRAE